MIEILVVTLGKHGESLLEATDRIIGRAGHIHSLTVDWSASLDEMKTKLDAKLAAIDRGAGVLLLTDVFGSTATNICFRCMQPGKVDVVTGVNLPMVIKAVTLHDGTSLKDAAIMLRNQGKKAITIASEML